MGHIEEMKSVLHSFGSGDMFASGFVETVGNNHRLHVNVVAGGRKIFGV